MGQPHPVTHDVHAERRAVEHHELMLDLGGQNLLTTRVARFGPPHVAQDGLRGPPRQGSRVDLLADLFSDRLVHAYLPRFGRSLIWSTTGRPSAGTTATAGRHGASGARWGAREARAPWGEASAGIR